MTSLDTDGVCNLELSSHKGKKLEGTIHCSLNKKPQHLLKIIVIIKAAEKFGVGKK